MMLNDIDFSEMFSLFEDIFKDKDYYNLEMIDKIKQLAYANFKCYQANMNILLARRLEDSNEKYKTISDNEWIARSVGEQRVNAKLTINQLISQSFVSDKTSPSSWLEDDIVYSVGEMIDRILIESIKQNDFLSNNEKDKIEKSKYWQQRVCAYLKKKVSEIEEKGFYEAIGEMRTYKI